MNARLGVVALAILLALPGFSQSQEQFLTQTGLDPDLVAMLTVEGPGGKVLFVFVYLNERTMASSIGSGLVEMLAPYVGQNAILVWAYSETGASYDPSAIWFAQGETRLALSPEVLIPLEGDFLAGELAPMVPVVAVVVLGQGINPAKGFAIHYGEAASATLAVSAGEEVAAAQAEASAEAQALAVEPQPRPCPGPCPTPCPGDPCCSGLFLFLLFMLLRGL